MFQKSVADKIRKNTWRNTWKSLRWGYSEQTETKEQDGMMSKSKPKDNRNGKLRVAYEQD
jgi:hypothetical protein